VKPPIAVKVVGGLGNQMHGYIAAFVISRETKRDVVLDGRWLSWTGSNGYRKCLLPSIAISEIFTPVIIKSIWAIKRGPLRRRLSSIAAKIDSRRYAGGLNADAFGSADEILEILQNDSGISSIEGYFSTWDWAEKAKNFEDYSYTISNLNNEVKEIGLKASNVIGVHVRLGDYLNHSDIFPIASESYFLEAIKLLQNKENEPYWIYTDDLKNLKIKYPKLFAESEKVYTPESMNELNSFYLLSCHSKLVISNSTFSSWAAHFSESKQKTQVICPSEYLVNEIIDTRPSQWMRLPMNPQR
jgi:hypothetical protein